MPRRKPLDVLEDEMFRRAVYGVERPKFDAKGRPIIDPRTGQPYVEHIYSDNLAMFLAKGLAPQKYRERSDVTLSGPANVELTARMAQLQRMLNEVSKGDRSQTQRLKQQTAQSNRSISLDVRRNGTRRPSDEV